MSNSAGPDAFERGRGCLTDRDCRARRLSRQRAALWPLLKQLLVEIPDVVCYDFKALHHLKAYRALEHEGLVHAGVVRAGGRVAIIVATRRVLRNPKLRIRLFALRKLARAELMKTLVVGPRGLLNEAARLRARSGTFAPVVNLAVCGR